ncbi:MAG: hypothetical protein K6U80_11835 [Firmicutes bacterium]|nr:hypothetical protein [Bacillota bacterium]
MKIHNQSVIVRYLLLLAILVVMTVGLTPVAFGSGTPIITTDPNELAIVDSRDFKQLTLAPGISYLTATINFYATPNFDEFLFYINTDSNPVADICIYCHPTNFAIYKSSTPNSGYFDILVATVSASIIGSNYYMRIDWTYIGADSFTVWLYDMTSGDRLPNTGSIAVTDPRIITTDPNEGGIADNQDFRKLVMLCGTSNLESKITFYAAPSFSEFFFYMNTDANPGADILVRCEPDSYSLYTSSIPNSGYFDVLEYTGTAGISGNDYNINIPWTYIPVSSFTVWLYNMSSGDRLPDSGVISVVK